MVENIKIWDELIEINNVTSLREFNQNTFILAINSVEYIIRGDNLELIDVSNNNSTLKIKGIFNQIVKKNYKKPKEKSFIKRLIS